MANRQISGLTAESSLDTTFVIPVQKADGSQEAKKASLAEVKTIFNIAEPILKTVKRVLSSSEILSLFTTPIEIVPSVEGKVLVPQFLFQKYNHNTTAFTTSGLFRIGLGTTSFGFVTFGAVITSAEDSEGLNNLIYAQSTSGLTYANLPIVVRATTANPEAGDGELELHLTYLEITV
jgi:hypothetical protein